MVSSESASSADAEPGSGYLFAAGGSFILDAAADPVPIWGRGQEVLQADGEALIVAAGQGLGKTALAQQYALGRCGFPEYAELLGLPVRPGRQRVLYLAMDRPRQAARSFRRMVGEAWRSELDDRLRVWPGPPPYDLAANTGVMLTLCRDAGADTLIVDSLKDAAVGLSDDVVGAGYNRARQRCIAAGVQILELHHPRKVANGTADRRKPDIDHVYGSTWLPSGAGSVVLLTGSPGDAIVGFHHIKQPAAEVGPFRIAHDYETGRSTVWDENDLLPIIQARGSITAVEAAVVMFGTEQPDLNAKKRAERKLRSMVSAGWIVVLEQGDKATRTPTRWGAK